MKIVDMKVRCVAIPMNCMLRHNTGVHPGYLLRTILELITDEGIVGLGEVGGGDSRAALLKLKPRIIGMNPMDLEAIKMKVLRSIYYISNSRLYGAIEIACLDIMGKAFNVPMHQLLGGKLRDSIPMIAYLFWRYDRPGGGHDTCAEDMADFCVQLNDELGVTAMKLKAGVMDPMEEVKVLQLCRQKLGDIVGMEEPFHYRNKAQYPIGIDRDGNVITGFYAGRTHTIIANTDCALGASENQQILETILSYMRKNKVTAYDEVTGKGLVRHVLIRKGFTSGQLMVCLVINKKMTKMSYHTGGVQKNTNEFLPNQGELLAALAEIQGMTSVSVSINTEKTNVIMGTRIHNLWGESTIEDTIHVRDMQKENYPYTGDALTFKISPLSFYQVNPVQTEKLYSLALEYAGLTGKETVWDLYCGIGTISLFLASKAKKVYGVEIIPQAIDDARENAKRNHIENAEFFVGKAEEVLPEFYKKASTEASSDEMLHPDVIVVDPPRKGCDDACLNTMLRMQPERIVYVSCDSATLARDLKILCDGGYEIRKVQGVDQFGMTVHVETVVLLSKGEVDSKKIRVEFSLEDMDMSEFQDGATYPQIKEYVLEHTGLKVSNLYISQIKRKCGIGVGKNYNLPKSEDSRQPQCPPEKEKAIREAFKYFGMI